jgi:hypothetical protein
MKLTTRYLSLALSAAAVVGCASDTTAPRKDAAADGLSLKVRTLRASATSADISVSPSGGTFALGKHAIRFPKRSICELTSSYGPTEWDKPCEPAQGPVNFHVEIVTVDGREWLHFTPAVRFVPTTRPSEYVTLFMRFDATQKSLSEADLQILWSPAVGVPGVDESLADSTLRTRVNYGAGMVQRRIKHFSAYVVRDGLCLITDTMCENSQGDDEQ